jgi:hypothetical protein
MSLGAVLDVIIGLVFTYLLLGMIASGVQEAWAALINKRGKELRDGISELLKGGGPLDLADKVFCHSLIFGLLPGKRIPSYVPSRNFGLALIETLRAGGQGPIFTEVESRVASLPPGDVKQSLTAFIAESKGDLETLRKSIETWFDDAMDRVSGAYKRYTQIFTALFGLAAAIVFNVDSIGLANTLWSNGPLREAAVAAAQQYAKDHPQTDDEKARAQSQQNLKETVGLLNQLPVGWVATAAEKQRWAAATAPSSAGNDGPNALTLLYWRLFNPDFSGLWILLGWLVTALATSLGAPFWFDALNNLLRLRNTGPKPKRSDDPAPTS